MTQELVMSRDFELPPDVDAMRRRLRDVRQNVGEFRRMADGMFLGVGLDGLIGLVPIVGGGFAALGGLWLLMHAIKAKCSLGTMMTGIALVVVDVVVGEFVGPGDVADFLFRSHAWFAGMILNDVEAKLAYVERTQQALVSASGEEQENRMRLVRNHLFRGGRSELASQIRIAIVAAICLFLVHECRRAQEARQETIRACEARGGWFCTIRH